MTDVAMDPGSEAAAPTPARAPIRGSVHTTEAANQRLAKRYQSEGRFRLIGLAAILFAALALITLLSSVVTTGFGAFTVRHAAIDVAFDEALIDPAGARDPQAMARADFGGLVKTTLKAAFPEVTGRKERRKLYGLVSKGAGYDLRDMVLADPSLIGQTRSVSLLMSDEAMMYLKGQIDMSLDEGERRVSDSEAAMLDKLVDGGQIEASFNWRFFQAGDSREPELAGIWGAMLGSFFTMMVTMLLSLPLGVAAAIYLEEFAPRNRWTDVIEVNINNLAAVPSIVFGLLGLALFLGWFGLPRSAPLVGGMVLALMTLPTIIIASRAALKSVPPSIREAALGLGASRVQTVFHHVLPLAMPGIMTGSIIGMAQALGETAPLLMIGMVAFIVDPPLGITDPATVLPVQVFIWADAPERAFVEKTAAAIMVLLGFLILMNALAVFLRRRFERRW